MNILLVVGVGAALLFVATRTYPFWIARIFGEDDARPTPAVELDDGQDYVPTKTPIVFGHHFASIAGAGPIVGPIIAIVYGWGPAWLWIIIGGILYGAVHDMSSMFVSIREGGKTIAEIARRTLGQAGYLLFVLFLLLVLSIVNAIFLKLSAAALTSAYPLEKLGLDAEQTLLRVTDDGQKGVIGGIATTSVIVMTLVAPVLGLLINRKRISGRVAFAIAGIVCLVSVLIGFQLPVALTPTTWMWILSFYVFVACGVPVWLILQPRDFMNVQILYVGLGLLMAGTIVAGFSGATMQMPMQAIDAGVAAKGPIWPIMFITIACGAISGFHSLVATGTTVKQIAVESDVRRVGYNAMILESFLALLVLVAVGSQMTGAEYTANMDPSQGGNAILTFAIGCGHIFAHLGIPMAIGCVLGILVIEGFLVTTLDTAIRLGRYLFEELFSALAGGNPHPILRHPVTNTACAVAMMLVFALSGKAYAALWPYFGAGNQLIGALTLTTVSIWLLRRGRTVWFAAIPAVFMVATAVYALGFIVWKEYDKGDEGGAVVVAAGTLLLALAAGFVVVAVLRVRGAVREAAAGAVQ